MKVMRMLRLFVPGAFLLLISVASASAQSRDFQPRTGIGVDLILAPFDNEVTNSAFGVGFRGRVAFPYNRDVSFAAGAGLAGFILEGRDEGVFVFNPQASVIVTMPRYEWAPYFLTGLGGFVPLNNRGLASGGPAFHAGIGWTTLLSETSVFVEINPSLVVGSEAATVLIPFRVGIILY